MDSKKTCCPEKALPGLAYTGPEPPTVKINGLRVYEVGSGPKGVVIIHDIFGLFGGRSLEYSNRLAENGFHVFFPDLLQGHKLTEGTMPIPDFAEKLTNIKWEVTRKEIFDTLVPYMKSKGVETFAALGFCWGPRVIANICAENDLFKVAVNFHASWEAFAIHGDKPYELAEKIRAAQIFLIASNDDPNFKEGGAYVNILKKNIGDKIKQVYYPKMMHGWVARTPVDQPETRKEAEDAVSKGIDFLKEHL